ncbi:hypothetical protein [Sphingobacterium sp. DR205]|uniref:hypothetical protein n=1 Tax=Sphingobacterium sp. DR205 TaxID=2713573 RepID=UPI0013E51935|nr:hypothetical protein [Sphingobacterium sp. DR205]QIH35953.1 hypothetical protein G6053_25105 [Sphingobacterium sp. DR205]
MKINRILTILFSAATLLVFNFCSYSKEDKYIGFWIEDGKEHSEVLEIKKEGNKLYLNSKDIEAPATYDKKEKTLSAQLTNGLASVNILMNLLEDTDKMKMSIGNKSADFSRISKEKAQEYKKAYDAYYDPDFFVGEWKSEVEQEKPLKITKEEETYFYVSDFLGKQRLVYDDKKHYMTGQIGLTSLFIKRSGDQEITAYGKKYQKIK